MPVEQEERLKPVLYDEEPSEEVLEWARKHINEDPDMKDQAISELRDMIFGENQFLIYLHCKKNFILKDKTHSPSDHFVLTFSRLLNLVFICGLNYWLLY